jgi:hypothetical protein
MCFLKSTWLAPRNSMGDQAGDRRATRMIRTQNLTQENPQRNQRRKDSVQPVRAERCQRLGNDLLRKDIGEGQIAILKKLAPQKLNLLPKPSRGWMCLTNNHLRQ